LEWKYHHKKSETFPFLGQEAVRFKIVVDNKSLQQVKNFEYLGIEISYENKNGVQQKLGKFSQMLGILTTL
jgi:hypothetical protein